MGTLKESRIELPEGYLQVPERFNMAVNSVDRHVKEGRGNNVAIYDGDKKITFAELMALENKFGHVLRYLGVKKDDAFVIRSSNCVAVFAAVLGGMKIGAVPIPTNTMFRTREMEHILNNSDAVLALSTPELVDVIEEVKDRCPTLKHIMLIGGEKPGCLSYDDLMKHASPELEAEDTSKDDRSYILYTSGTTGNPKGVEHAHRWLIGSGDPIAKLALRLTPQDVVLHPQEISFMFPFGNSFFFPFHCGAAVVLYYGRFNPDTVFESVQKYKVTVLNGVPTMYRMLLAEPGTEKKYDLSSLKLCHSAGEPLPAESFNEFLRRFGVKIYDCLGQTEPHEFVGNIPGMEIKPGSMGKPFPGVDVRILDDDQNECPVGVTGEVCINRNHPGLFLSYRKMPEREEQVLRGDWYYTQDKAYRDEDGYYWYVSRSDDLIKSRGYLISPKEVEEACVELPWVLEAAAVGSPDPMMGQKVKVFLTMREKQEVSPELEEVVIDHVKARLAPYKAPKEVEFVEELPKTATGKIRRKVLKEMEEQRYKERTAKDC